MQWKATWVIHMLEKRVGREVFRRVVERLISRAAHAVRSGLCSSARFLSTHSFLKEVGQSGGVRKEIQAFAERCALKLILISLQFHTNICACLGKHNHTWRDSQCRHGI